MMEKMMPEMIKVSEDTYILDEGGVRFFLLLGSKKALLIDSGMMVHHAKELAEGITDLPLELLNTHADMDHVGSNQEFDAFYMHAAEEENFLHTPGPHTGKIIPVADGDLMDLGDRPLKIIHTPGHTPGSIAVLDIKKRVIITGDPIQDGKIFMFGPARKMEPYLESLLKVKALSDEYDEIWPSHGSLPVKAELIDDLYTKAMEVLAGNMPYEKADFHGMSIRYYNVGIAGFLMDDK